MQHLKQVLTIIVFCRFPDHEEMHEVIGYGGDVDYSSDEEEEER